MQYGISINLVLVLVGKKLMSLLMIQKMVSMKIIAIESYQNKIHLINKMVVLTNMIGINMIMENHHRVIGSNESLVKN